MSLPTGSQNRRRTPWYLITLLFFFVIPVSTFLITQWKKMDRGAFFKALGVIVPLGYLWSMLVSGQKWWVFNADNMLGINILPFLPVEEVMFYPLGGALCILLYTYFESKVTSDKTLPNYSLLIFASVSLISLVLVIISIIKLHGKPYYVISQLLLYNTLTLALWPRARKITFWRPLLITILLMTGIGFVWDCLAFHWGWWTYYAILGWMFPKHVPIDDWNFYFFAPIAAIELYSVFRKERKQ